MLKDHLKQLVKARHLTEFVVSQGGLNAGQGSRNRSNNALPPPLGIIEVIHAPKADAKNQPKKRLKRTSV